MSPAIPAPPPPRSGPPSAMAPESSNFQAQRYQPYSTLQHRITKGRYITSNDPRGYVTKWMCLIGQWIMMDVDDGYVLWTGIWKALGNTKADIVKMLESQPDLAPQLRRVRGGYLKIQGTWMPFEVALKLARRVAWPIREDLVPLFGPTFPSTCLSPDQPGYGQVVATSGKRKSRRTVQPPALPIHNPPNPPRSLAYHPEPQWYGYPSHGNYRPASSPSCPPSTYDRYHQEAPHYPHVYSERPKSSYKEGGGSPIRDRHAQHSRYSPYPSAHPPPRRDYAGSREAYGSRSQAAEYEYLPSNHTLQSRSSDSNLRRAHDPHERLTLPPISALAPNLPSPRGAFTLPPLVAPSVSTTRASGSSDIPVLGRMRMSSTDDSDDAPRPPPEAYFQQRRSSSAPPLHLGPSRYQPPGLTTRQHRSDNFAWSSVRGGPATSPPPSASNSTHGDLSTNEHSPVSPRTPYGSAWESRINGHPVSGTSSRRFSEHYGGPSRDPSRSPEIASRDPDEGRRSPPDLPSSQANPARVGGCAVMKYHMLIPELTPMDTIELQPLPSSRPFADDDWPQHRHAMKFSNSLKFNANAEWWEEYIAYSALKKQIYTLESELPVPGQSQDAERGERAALLGGEHHRQAANAIFQPLLDAELAKINTFYDIQEKELLYDVAELEQLVVRTEEEGINNGHGGIDSDDGSDEDEDEDETRSNGGIPSVERHRSGSQSHALSNSRTLSNSVVDEPISATRPDPTPLTHSVLRGGNADLEASIASLRGPGSDSGVSPHSQNQRRRATSLSTLHPKTPLATLIRLVKPGNASNAPIVGETIWQMRSPAAIDLQMLFKRRITTLYISLTSLKSYVELNYTGFRKILKKYDKITYNELKDHYMHNIVEKAAPFTQQCKDRLRNAISRTISLYAKCVTRGDISAALRQLRVHQREHIVWERDTVWRQMIGRERRGEGADGRVKALGLGHVDSQAEPLLTAFGLKLTKRKLVLLLAILLFVVLLNVHMVEGKEANRCLAILIFATVLWATEAIPLFITSMGVPLLVVSLRVIRGPAPESRQLSAEEATKYIFSYMFSPTIMLLIGGFTISSALSKTNIDRVLITRVLSIAGTRPSVVLLSFMAVSCFASMWISNVAAPTLCFTLIKPILRTLPQGSSFAPCLILAIALAANIGGQSSPISSPQNLITLQYMDPPLDWLQWFAVAIPVSALTIFVIWLLLLVSYKPGYAPDGTELRIRPIRPTKESFTLKQYWVSIIDHIFGDMGVIAIIPIVAFFSTNVLKKEDFEQFLWTIVFLAMGGIALGKAVVSSGLLATMDDGIVSTFISHTIASVLLVPIAAEVGSNLPDPHPRLLVFITGLICSAGMGMPVSGFPNQTAATQEDEMGKVYLSNTDFLKNGVPASVVATMIVATVGYTLMRVVLGYAAFLRAIQSKGSLTIIL
ncbi:transport protein [Rhizoctonia solani]|uniref:Transport protein n=1 Tax=Rhizoctonia solani TaxID=456999 RepID=A0A8H8NSG5_9AGAM|nr:transport protein [Rhizoctonia solani]QRW17947.1 transport protein [Rhizoctonia solani]